MWSPLLRLLLVRRLRSSDEDHFASSRRIMRIFARGYSLGYSVSRRCLPARHSDILTALISQRHDCDLKREDFCSQLRQIFVVYLTTSVEMPNPPWQRLTRDQLVTIIGDCYKFLTRFYIPFETLRVSFHLRRAGLTLPPKLRKNFLDRRFWLIYSNTCLVLMRRNPETWSPTSSTSAMWSTTRQ